MGNVINFDTGVREYNLNGNVSVTFSPTDMHFIESVFNAMETIDAMYTKYQEKVTAISDRGENEKDYDAGVDLFNLSHEADVQIREKVNGIFDKDICTPTIGNMSILTPAGGLPIWANILLAFIDLFDDQMVEEKKKMNPRIEKYTKKYNRKR